MANVLGAVHPVARGGRLAIGVQAERALEAGDCLTLGTAVLRVNGLRDGHSCPGVTQDPPPALLAPLPTVSLMLQNNSCQISVIIN